MASSPVVKVPARPRAGESFTSTTDYLRVISVLPAMLLALVMPWYLIQRLVPDAMSLTGAGGDGVAGVWALTSSWPARVATTGLQAAAVVGVLLWLPAARARHLPATVRRLIVAAIVVGALVFGAVAVSDAVGHRATPWPLATVLSACLGGCLVWYASSRWRRPAPHLPSEH